VSRSSLKFSETQFSDTRGAQPKAAGEERQVGVRQVHNVLLAIQRQYAVGAVPRNSNPTASFIVRHGTHSVSPRIDLIHILDENNFIALFAVQQLVDTILH
jgi:hypothetical protein